MQVQRQQKRQCWCKCWCKCCCCCESGWEDGCQCWAVSPSRRRKRIIQRYRISNQPGTAVVLHLYGMYLYVLPAEHIIRTTGTYIRYGIPGTRVYTASMYCCSTTAVMSYKKVSTALIVPDCLLLSAVCKFRAAASERRPAF